jgi:glycosyltransferase involved in cell wall biosynthesis
MKIHYIVPTFAPNPTGFAIAFFNLVKVFESNNMFTEVIIYTPETEQPYISNKVKYVHLKNLTKSNWFISKFAKLFGKFLTRVYLHKQLKMIRYTEGDLIFVESIYLAHISSILADRYGKDNIVLRIHGASPEIAHWTKDILRNRMMDFTLELNNIAVTTYHYINYLHCYFDTKNVINHKYFIIPNTLPDIIIEDNISYNKSNKLKMIQLGRMDKFGFFQKGFHDTLQALIFLEGNMNSKVCKNIELTIIGSGDLHQSFKKKLKKLKKIKVIVYESLSNLEVKKEVNAADLILLPSRFEGMSMFATECISMGKPFVFTDNGGLCDMILDEVNGLAVRPFDYLGIANAIIQYYDNPDLLSIHSLNSKKIFQEKFSYSTVSKLFELMVNVVK